MCLIDQLLDVLFSWVSLFSEVLLYQDIYSNRLFYILFEKEELEFLCIVLKSSNQIKVFISVPLFEVFIYLCLDIPRSFSFDVYSFADKFLRKLNDVVREPTIKWKGLNVFMSAEYYDEIFAWVYRAVRNAYRDHNWVGLAIYGHDDGL